MSYYFYIPLLFISLLGGGMLKDYIEVKYCRLEKENNVVLSKED